MREHRRASDFSRRCWRGGDIGLLQQGGQGGVSRHLPSSEHLRAAPLLGTHRLSTFRGKDVQPPRSAASFSSRAIASFSPQRSAPGTDQLRDLLLRRPPPRGAAGVTYSSTEVAREGSVPSPLPTFLHRLTPSQLQKCTPFLWHRVGSHPPGRASSPSSTTMPRQSAGRRYET